MTTHSAFIARLPHRVSRVLVAATFCLIVAGGVVTTLKAGMAVPDWPNTFGHNLFLYPLETWLSGPRDLFFEHGHRLLGAAVGLLTIGLAACIWVGDRRRWVRGLSVVAIAAVVVQGLLGGLRVIENERLLAQVHGAFGPAFFAVTVALAAVTSVWWREGVAADSQSVGKLQRLAVITAVLAYAQILLGGRLRHVPLDVTPGEFRAVLVFHLATAGILAGHVAALAVRAWRTHRGERALARPAAALTVLFALQLLLGGGAWVFNYGWPNWLPGGAGDAHVVVASGPTQALVTTAHVAVGSLILAFSLSLVLRSFRCQPLAAVSRAAAALQQPASTETSASRLFLAGVAP